MRFFLRCFLSLTELILCLVSRLYTKAQMNEHNTLYNGFILGKCLYLRDKLLQSRNGR